MYTLIETVKEEVTHESKSEEKVSLDIVLISRRTVGRRSRGGQRMEGGLLHKMDTQVDGKANDFMTEFAKVKKERFEFECRIGAPVRKCRPRMQIHY